MDMTTLNLGAPRLFLTDDEVGLALISSLLLSAALSVLPVLEGYKLEYYYLFYSSWIFSIRSWLSRLMNLNGSDRFDFLTTSNYSPSYYFVVVSSFSFCRLANL